MVEKAKNKFFTSFTFLFFYLPIILVILFFTVTFIFFYKRQQNLAYKKVLSDLHSETITYEENLNIFLTQKTKKVEDISLFFSNYDLITPRKRRSFFKSYIYDLQYNDNEVYSFWTGFKPYSIDNYDDQYKNEDDNITGQFFYTVYKVNQHIEEKPVDVYDYENLSKYLNLFRQKNKSLFIAPIKDTNEILTGVSYLIRFIAPVVNNNNQMIGITGLDVDTKFLDKFFTGKGQVYLLNSSQEIIYDSEHANIGKKFLKVFTYYPKIDELSRIILSYKNQSGYGYFNDINKKNFYDVVFFNPANKNDQWILINLKDADYFKNTDTSNYLIPVLFLLLGAIVIIFVVYLYINYLRKYLNEVKSYQDKLFAQETLNIKSHYYNDLANELNSTIRQNRRKIELVSEFINKLKSEQYDVDLEFEKDNILTKPLVELKDKLKDDKKTYLEQLNKQEINSLIVNATATVNDILRENINDIEQLSYEIIKFIGDFTDAIQAGFYIINEDENDNSEQFLNLVAFHSYNRKVYHKKKIHFGDGLVGACAIEQKPVFTKIPDDYLEITSGLGKEKPNYLYIVPLIYNDVIFGILEFTYILKPKDYLKQFIVDVSTIIASTINTSKNNERTQQLLEKTEQIRLEMENKEKDLVDRLQTLDKLQKESRKLQLEYKAIRDAILKIAYFAEFDTDANILNINEALSDAINFTYAEATLLTYYELFNITDKEKHQRYWAKVLKGDSIRIEFAVYLATKTVWINAVLSPVYNIEGEIYKVILVGIDYTNLKMKEAKLNELLDEVNEKAEQLDIQEKEFDEFIKDYEDISSELETVTEENERSKKSMEFLQKEMEKRVRRAKKIQVNLNQKIKKLEREIRDLKGEN